MKTISLCMIVKNEERVLGRCLESVKGLFDEIVVVDTGSTDKTVEIARAYGAKVFSFAWANDFSKARNFSFSKATKDYLCWLDADDIVNLEQREEFFLIKRRLETNAPDAVFCRYECPVDAYTPPLSYLRERFFKRSQNPVWRGVVHECVEVKGSRAYSDFTVTHQKSDTPRGTRNLDIYRNAIVSGAEFSARDLFYYGRELYYHRFYLEAIGVWEEFLARTDGWSVNKIEACKLLSQCYELKRDTPRALTTLTRAFSFGAPRAGILCALAHLSLQSNQLSAAAEWYSLALHCPSHEKDGDFETAADSRLTPLLGLTYCYYKMGKREQSKRFHEEAKTLFPTHPSVVYNEKFFSSIT